MKKEILISIYDMEIGGIERSLINMLESFDYDKYNIDLLIFNHKGDFLDLIPEGVNLLPEIKKLSVFRKSVVQCLREGHYLIAGLRIICRYIANIKAKLRSYKEGSGYIQMQLVSKYSSKLMPKLSKKYDLAISYAWPHNILAEIADAKKKIAWIHTDYSELEIDNKLDLVAWSNFDYVASISDACTESFLTKYPSLRDKIILIENINSPAFIKRMAHNEISPFNKKDNTFIIVSVGRLSYVKGFDMGIKALRLLHDRGYTNIKWYVVGYGNFEEELKELVNRYQVTDSFILLGKKPNPYPYIEACDLYVQPSRYEGKAVTVTEAQILEKPILITNYPTASSQVQDGVDGVICQGSVEGIASGIEQMYLNKEIRALLQTNLKNRSYSNSDEVNKIYQITG